jgi:crossover junction endodeoxyribonuclease RuvC
VREADAAGRQRLVLGVDPGSAVTGWGVVRADGARLEYVDSGVLRLRGGRAARLARIYAEVRDLCVRLRPDVLSLEESFVGDNVQTAFRLGEARGAVMVAAATCAVPVVEYSPAGIKMAVVGSGRADKLQVQAMVARLLGIGKRLIADESDALGAAICHVHLGRFDATLAGAIGFGGAGGRRRGRRGARKGWT